ncbi:uncharacterized protein LTR77_001914 [Saxophila tyrrhenica]|uniref:MARVEL domain-containing protein n=1 Tax=Saxophila tyrrhenica TaxID=1690608 RepID=A0AAV9PPK1_9PEZI|nr:hypothetical protein LTR77_001914 [Saxophila tyrrhenica]
MEKTSFHQVEAAICRPSKTVPLIAASFSFVYHLSLAILANYVPLDRAGVAATLWIYSWAACVVGYFGLIAVVASRPILTRNFSYLLFLDAAFSALWRFALLEWVLRNTYRDHCEGREHSNTSDDCGLRFRFLHGVAVAVLGLSTLAEVLLANSVRRYACGLRERTADEELVDVGDAVTVMVQTDPKR